MSNPIAKFTSSTTRGIGLLGVGALLALAPGGCSRHPTRPQVPQAAVAPVPSTPENAVRLLLWCWEHRSVPDYRGVFTDDYRFAFAAYDSFGNAFLTGFTREMELEAANRIFTTGTARLPPASRITVGFDPNLTAFPDSRPGKMDPWHKEVPCRTDISIDFADGSGARILAALRFFVARGDSALIPQDLRLHASGSDTSRWYVERWEEEGYGGTGLTPTRALPTRALTWGYLKRVYLEVPSPSPLARKR